MRKLRIYPKAASSYATPYNLKFFDYANNEMLISDIATGKNSASFKLNGVNATIECPNIYTNGTYYYISYVLLSNNYSMLTGQTAAVIADPVAKKAGFLITFESEVKIKEIELKENRSGYACSGYIAMINESKTSEPVAVPALQTAFRITLPNEVLKVMRKKDEPNKVYFKNTNLTLQAPKG